MKRSFWVLIIVPLLFGVSSKAVAAPIYGSDLDIYLFHESSFVQLFEGGKDDSQGNLITLFDDESTNFNAWSAPFPSDMQPFESLSAFDGSNLSGSWQLIIHDNYIPGDGDYLASWYLSGTLSGGGLFNILGPSAFNVDSSPATVVELTTTQIGQITDLNVGINISAVPEPATMLLLGSGLIGLAGIRRKAAKICRPHIKHPGTEWSSLSEKALS